MSTLEKIVGFLDRELKIAEFEDSSNNGLQVENSGRIGKVCCGVDASMEMFEESRRLGADLVITHHGISWGDSMKRISGLNYSRVGYLIRNDMALYSCHLPLDAHPVYGNNAQICDALGLRDVKPFGEYHGSEIGFEGRLPKAMTYASFKKLVTRVVGTELKTMDFGKKRVTTVAVVSGGAAGEVDEAGGKGVDVYLSGEPALVAYSLAQEHGINAIFAGHYATEVFGVKALARLLKKKFKLDVEFVDLGVPY